MIVCVRSQLEYTIFCQNFRGVPWLISVDPLNDNKLAVGPPFAPEPDLTRPPFPARWLKNAKQNTGSSKVHIPKSAPIRSDQDKVMNIFIRLGYYKMLIGAN